MIWHLTFFPTKECSSLSVPCQCCRAQRAHAFSFLLVLFSFFLFSQFFGLFPLFYKILSGASHSWCPRVVCVKAVACESPLPVWLQVTRWQGRKQTQKPSCRGAKLTHLSLRLISGCWGPPPFQCTPTEYLVIRRKEQPAAASPDTPSPPGLSAARITTQQVPVIQNKERKQI